MLLHVVADFGHGDLAFAEVAQRFLYHLPSATILPTPVPPFATLTVGFCVAQLAMAPAPEGTVVFHNVAPRRDDAGPRADQGGEALACAVTPSGALVVGVNAGHAFSFLRDAGIEVRSVAASSAGSQFRSRDVFPEAVARLVAGDAGAAGDIIASERIPPVPPSRLAYVDGFGNLKTTIPAGDFAPGAKVRVTLSGRTHEAVCAGGGFGVAEGALAFAAGSSGWQRPDGAVRWMELFLRGGSAWELFGRPAPGATLDVQGLPVVT